MIKIYHSSKIDAAYWRIYTDFVNKSVSYFPTGTTATEVANKLCQFSLFEDASNTTINVVDISDWKLTDASTKQAIANLQEIDNLVIFALEATSSKNKTISDLKIEVIKAPLVNKVAKAKLIDQLIFKNEISITPEAKQRLNEMLPENVQFITNEISKLKLYEKQLYDVDDVQQVVYDTGDATVFNVIDAWLSKDYNTMLMRLNTLFADTSDVKEIVPVFAFKLIQIKMYLEAKLAKWSSDEIFAKLAMPIWAQNQYAILRPYDKSLQKINQILSKLYNFDMDSRIKKSDTYANLIKILVE